MQQLLSLQPNQGWKRERHLPIEVGANMFTKFALFAPLHPTSKGVPWKLIGDTDGSDGRQAEGGKAEIAF